MTTLPLVLIALLALVVGALAGYLVGQHRRQASPDLEQENSRLLAELAAAQEGKQLLAERVEALESRARTDQDVLRALAPVKSQLATVEQQVRVMERERADQFGSVREALEVAQRGQDDLRESTHHLSSALRATSARGSWGETQLRRVVEAAGMTPHVTYSEQVSSEAPDASGNIRRVRPDMVVSLPAGKEIVLDSKAPLDAYLESQEAVEEPEKAAWEAKHAKSVRAHVDALAAKRYWDSREVSPEIVLCFLPMESALSAALRADAGLLDYASGKGVALVSPISLLASLKAVALSWRQEAVSQNARDLLQLSRQLYERLATVGGHLGAMGRSLTKSVEAYNSMLGSLESRVLVTARRINDMDATQPMDERLSVRPVDAAAKPLTAPEFYDEEPPLTAGGSEDVTVLPTRPPENVDDHQNHREA
ncbi:DNA recombination protein RmuC [Kocuria massiliensis]|uniref:DNA recombination protein RmuC n=1 Tax=Kocuria massiliensis TaxID=1926282 RepID=UPI0022B940C3|nr:DNA recombination protein RmuC [Kocuria massiliensis]